MSGPSDGLRLLQTSLAGRYEVERELGRGGVAVVYLARDPRHERVVALKLLRADLGSEESEVRFAREIKFLARLQHPNILPLLDSGQVGTTPYYVVPFVEGMSLRQRLDREHQLPLSDALSIVREVADALEYAHRHGVVHRDIKPENILLSGPHAIVADFGIARYVESARDARLTRTGMGGPGTPAYMSPEQLLGERDIDGRSDIYSLACVLFEMLAGEPPFSGQGGFARRLVELPPPMSSFSRDVPPAVEAAMTRALASEPCDRFATAAEFGTALSDGRPSWTPTTAASGARQAGPWRHLPLPTSPLIGREDAIKQICALLQERQLVTVLGPGGVGKSHLAARVASELARTYRHGTYFVSLVSASSPAALVSSIAEALGIELSGCHDPTTQLRDFLREKHLLLILDSFEHLVATAGVLADTIQGASQVRLLVTSRERLNISAETVHELRGLSVPESGDASAEQHPAVRLFVERARRSDPAFSLLDGDMPHVIKICRLVVGLPLALEIAAAMARILSCREIAQEIERSFDALATPLRDVPERHRSLRAVFESSWALLSARERDALMRLSVFRAGFRRDAGESVAGASLGLLLALADKSLVHRTACGRYEMHEVVRQYADEKLRESPDAQARTERLHAEYFARFLSVREERIKGDTQRVALDEIAEEIASIRTGWAWATGSGDGELMEKYVDSLWRFYASRSWFKEGSEDFEFAERVAEPRVIEAKVLTRFGMFCFWLGLIGRARAALRRSLAALRVCGAQKDMIETLRNLGTIASSLGKYRAAQRLQRRCIEICRATGDAFELATTLNNLANTLVATGSYAEAERALCESIEIRRAIGDRHGLAAALLNLGVAFEAQNRLDEAWRLFQQVFDLAPEVESRRLAAAALLNLGNVSIRSGRSEEAKPYIQAALEHFREIGVHDGVLMCVRNLGKVEHALGHHNEAAQLFSEALRIAARIDAPPRLIGIVICLATLYRDTGNLDRSLQLAGAVLHHPALCEGDRRELEELLTDLMSRIPTCHVTAIHGRGHAGDLDREIQRLLHSEIPTAKADGVADVEVGISDKGPQAAHPPDWSLPSLSLDPERTKQA